MIGTPLFMSPEIINAEPYNSSTDIWSLGITLIQIAEGQAPKHELPSMQAMIEICTGEPPTLKPCDSWTPEMHAFLAQCLQRDTSARPSAEELREHPWIAELSISPEKILEEVAREYYVAVNEPEKGAALRHLRTSAGPANLIPRRNFADTDADQVVATQEHDA
eukprot:CAMPEP_0177674588 /NCGR_PEP_ID=MMETSP0447-20121125/26653_1 /TAXON_ID=0 /ORGANISM="Stygamoeba regulata, Strain BSH-02190019" /LENGTH=163 /DNA_ID=CAMNT_0019182729 /DNA_START=74 /DNA_END=561 /DNA_ORIENTATION=+